MSTRGKTGGDKAGGKAGTKRRTSAQDQAQTGGAPAAESPAPGGAEPADDTDGSPLWRRLVVAVRGGINELGEAIADSQALRILDQEIRDADAELARARIELGELRAHYKLALERQHTAAAEVTEYEGYALKALKSGDDTLARAVATKVAQLEGERDARAEEAGSHKARIETARKAIAQRESAIRRLHQQVDTVRATESMQRAQAAVANRHLGTDTRLQTALQALERIRRRQAERGARLDVEAEANDEDALLDRLRRAGILEKKDDGAEAVLARLKRRRRD